MAMALISELFVDAWCLSVEIKEVGLPILEMWSSTRSTRLIRRSQFQFRSSTTRSGEEVRLLSRPMLFRLIVLTSCHIAGFGWLLGGFLTSGSSADCLEHRH